jgi:iron complex outermembrane receptor protein
MRFIALSLALALSVAPVAGRADIIEEVIVTATLREQSLIEAPISITVLDEQRLRDAGRQHFEDVLAGAPNLHWAAGTSRPRYFQIRGIGEREQYEGAPNPSVGFLIDDIDFSGAAMPATLFDVERIEVLRGPQGMRYGANALAGLIVMRSHDPEEDVRFASEASVGDYDSRSIGVVATGPAESLNSAWRVAVQQYASDGFRDNAFLGRDDTNNRDELMARAKWRWRAGDVTNLDLTWLHADIDNGYDAWSIDNTRRSLADDPGKDAQRANGASLRLTTLNSLGRLTVIAAGSDTQSEYSFDGDWGDAQSWAPYTYDYFYRALSSRSTRSLEARLASEAVAAPEQIAWLVGVYALSLKERIDETSVGEYIDPDFPEFSGATDDRLHSDYDARNIALFGQLDGLFSARWGWSFGLRAEQRDADYQDHGFKEAESRSTDADERDRMWGGQATVHFDPREQVRLFATLSRGYKAGGFNVGRSAELQARFDPEYLWSLDAGAKAQWLDGAIYADVVAFYMKRNDMQIATGVQLDPIGDPNSYLFITDNVSGGSNVGVEASLRWRASDRVEFGAALGLLDTSYAGYRSAGVALPDREQAHAPEYQASFNASWRHPLGWMARIDVNAVDDYYFDVPPNDERADAYALTNVKIGYEAERWSAYLWGRNVFDEDYITRGFFFGNEPPLFENKRYTQLGEPRQIGATVRVEF